MSFGVLPWFVGSNKFFAGIGKFEFSMFIGKLILVLIGLLGMVFTVFWVFGFLRLPQASIFVFSLIVRVLLTRVFSLVFELQLSAFD